MLDYIDTMYCSGAILISGFLLFDLFSKTNVLLYFMHSLSDIIKGEKNPLISLGLQELRNF